MNKLCLVSVALLALAACDDDSPKADAGPRVDGGPAGDDAMVPIGDWLVLNEGAWTMPPGADRYYCIVETIEEDVYIKAFKGLIPLGTHHTVLTIYTGTQPDGVFECSSGTNGQNMIYGTGVGTPEMHFPEGVAVKLTKGQRVLNNVHLFNSGDATITGVSGTLYQPIAAAQVQHEAELVLTGPVVFSETAAADQTRLTITGSCSISNVTQEPIQVFAISPHMHQRGRHITSTLIRGTEKTIIQNKDYSFDEQTFTMQPSPFLELLPGDKLQTECEYDTLEQKYVGFGEKSTDEMCFTDIFYFPRQGAGFICPY